MILVGMTGGSGSGKSTVARHLQGRGIPVIDCDALYHELIAGPSSCTEALVSRFGKQIEKEDGGIDRAVLSHIVFAQDAEGKKALADLNAITHKYVTEALFGILAELKARGERLAVLDAPTLIESGIHKQCDTVLAICADKDACLARIASRDGLSIEDASMRIASQKDRAFYAEHADFIIENNEDEAHLLSETDKLLRLLLREVKA